MGILRLISEDPVVVPDRLSLPVSKTERNLSTDLNGHQAYHCKQRCSTLAADPPPHHEVVPRQRARSPSLSSLWSQSEGSSPSPNLGTESMQPRRCHRGCPRPVQPAVSTARAGTCECAWAADLERGWWDVELRWRRRWSWRWAQWQRILMVMTTVKMRGFGHAHENGYGLELEPRPKHVDGGPHALHASHPHGPCPHLVSPLGCFNFE